MPRFFWLLLLGTIVYMTTKTAIHVNRGIRNNNPLNIRIGNDWQGEAKSRDAEFETFEHSKYGFRAGAKLLRNYQHIYKLHTIEQIINRFAPPNENHTSHYAGFVAKKMGVAVNAPIDLSNDKTLANMMLYMSIMEVGHHYEFSDAWAGVQLA